ncbi:PAS and ANTAR domain-containing protein [Arthrobacter sp. 92]|uniref:PAS and ANTAR domain-containing protein n=1 Tax=Arthrobacter sp. 92 TaxID=3418175 RepID=UPI003D07DF5F
MAHASATSADWLTGTFRYDAISRKLDWSEELYVLHGYGRGDVVPTIDLLMAHIHPDDRRHARETFSEILRVGGWFCDYHRILDGRRREHRVLTVGAGVFDDRGRLCRIEGLMIDLTRLLRKETERVARAAVAGANATRGTIEQAKGILMGALRIGSEEAFQLLVAHSQHANIRLADTAADMVRLASDVQEPALLEGFIKALRSSAASRRSRAATAHQH